MRRDRVLSKLVVIPRWGDAEVHDWVLELTIVIPWRCEFGHRLETIKLLQVILTLISLALII